MNAFTLVEVLVATVVSILLVVVLLELFSASLTTWQRGESQVDAYREARGALQLMARDLSTTLQASYPGPLAGSTTVTATPKMPTLILNRYPAPLPARAAGDSINEEVYCMTNVPNRGSSQLCAIGYFCQWMPDAPKACKTPNQPPSAFAIMRQSLDSNGTFTRIQTATTTAAGGTLAFSDLFDRQSLLDTTAAPSGVAMSTPMASYIWDLKFRVDTDLTFAGDSENPPLALDHSSPQVLYDGVSSPPPLKLPTYIEIRFKALSTAAGQRLENNGSVTRATWSATPESTASNLDKSFYKSLILPNAQQFVLRVPLVNATVPSS